MMAGLIGFVKTRGFFYVSSMSVFRGLYPSFPVCGYCSVTVEEAPNWDFLGKQD